LTMVFLLTMGTQVIAVTKDCTSGDINGDGQVNIRDLGLFQQYLNGWDVIVDEESTDTNGDGQVNVRDVGLLQQYLNGWDVELAPIDRILTAEELAFYQSVVDSENAWLASTQLTNGALPMTPARNGMVKVNPYFADFAALSLLNQADKYAANVKAYMDWHFAHLNTATQDYNGVDGTIYDYNVTVKNGTVVKEEILYQGNKNSYDSTDSYAATFLMVLQKYAEKTGDTAYIRAHATDIERVGNALFATMDNGLTMAKPTSPVKLLMDNCEVYAGLRAAAALYRKVLEDTATADSLDVAAIDVVAHIESYMWAGDHYHIGLTQMGMVYAPFSWTEYYPSATAQLFPILHGVLDPASDRAQTLYTQFCNRYDWEHLNHPDAYMWSSNAYTAAVMGDYERVHTFLSVYNERVSASRGYPLYNADAAWACMTAYYMTQV